jgi:hypothetical protein
MLLLGESGEGAGEDEPIDAVGIGGRVRRCHHAAVRVSEERHPFEPEVSPQLVQIGDVVGDLICPRVGRAVDSLPRGLRRINVKLSSSPARSPK